MKGLVVRVILTLLHIWKTLHSERPITGHPISGNIRYSDIFMSGYRIIVWLAKYCLAYNGPFDNWNHPDIGCSLNMV